MKAAENEKPANKFATIVLTGLLAGTLDAIGAFAWNYPTSPLKVFKFIASGAFGKAAFAGGTNMVLWGILFHYIIALSFSAVLFLMYPSFISKLRNKYVTAIVFALITWAITTLIIVPLSCIGWRPLHLKGVLIGFGILIFTIGLPVVLIADRFYFKKRDG